jgi:hypothetical protein
MPSPTGERGAESSDDRVSSRPARSDRPVLGDCPATMAAPCRTHRCAGRPARRALRRQPATLDRSARSSAAARQDGTASSSERRSLRAAHSATLSTRRGSAAAGDRIDQRQPLETEQQVTRYRSSARLNEGFGWGRCTYRWPICSMIRP